MSASKRTETGYLNCGAIDHVWMCGVFGNSSTTTPNIGDYDIDYNLSDSTSSPAITMDDQLAIELQNSMAEGGIEATMYLPSKVGRQSSLTVQKSVSQPPTRFINSQLSTVPKARRSYITCKKGDSIIECQVIVDNGTLKRFRFDLSALSAVKKVSETRGGNSTRF